jgi:hypothetical protein
LNEKLVEAVGVELRGSIENMELTENTERSTIKKRTLRALFTRNTHAEQMKERLMLPLLHFL